MKGPRDAGDGTGFKGGTGLQAGALAIREILFATDFSPTSNTVGLYARALAEQLAVPLTVMHVFLLSQGASEAEAVTQHRSAQRQDLMGKVARLADALSPTHLAAAPLLCEGEPASEIERVAAGKPGVCLVLGTHGGSALGRHLIGSAAEQILTAVSCPTLTVGPCVGEPRDTGLFGKVLYATDCSHAGTRAAPLACAFSRSVAGRLKVISVVDDDHGPVADTLATFDFDTRQELTRSLHDECNNFTESRMVSSPAEAQRVILSTLTEDANDLLILGLQQHDSLGMAERNSRTFQIIALASTPVLTITDRAFQ